MHCAVPFHSASKQGMQLNPPVHMLAASLLLCCPFMMHV